MKRKLKKTVALALTVTMVFSLSMTSVFAYSDKIYEDSAPDEIKVMEDDYNILSGATAAANTTAMSILGIDVTSTDTAGVLNAMSDTDAPLNLLVFGSDLNENPDPYLWNFYYNLNANGETYPNREGQDEDFDESQINHDDDEYYENLTALDKELLLTKDIYKERSNYMSWKGAYTLLNYAKAGPTGAATDEGTIPIRVNSETATKCNPLFYFEPDILMDGTKGSYTIGLNYYKSKVNPDYTPKEVPGWGTDDGQYAINTGTIESTFAMANGVYTMAKEIQDYADKNDLESRYNDGSVLQCGIDYSSFALGIYYYLQSRLNPISSLISQIPKATYCTGIYVTDSGEITVTNDCEKEFQRNQRYMQYLDCIADCVEADSEKVYGSYGDLKKDVDLIIMDTSSLRETQKRMINQVNIKLVDISEVMPNTVYGTTMQSADNILGLPYFVGLLYEGDLSSYSHGLSEYDYMAYFVKNIYHVNDKDVEAVVAEMLRESGGDVYETFEVRGLTNSYEYYIDSMIEIGAWYYSQTALGSGGWLAVDEGWISVDSGD